MLIAKAGSGVRRLAQMEHTRELLAPTGILNGLTEDELRRLLREETLAGGFRPAEAQRPLPRLALAAGAIDPAHIEGASTANGPIAPGAASAALVSNLLLRRFPGPGSAIVETRLRYGGAIGVGDKLTVTVTARVKHDDGQRMDF